MTTPSAIVLAIAFSVLPLALCLAEDPSSTEATDRVDDLPNEVQQRALIQDFQQNLTRLNPAVHIEACSHAVSVITFGAGHDASYGAICKVKSDDTSRTYLMCDDILVGVFTLRVGGYSITRDTVVKFVRANCLG